MKQTVLFPIVSAALYFLISSMPLSSLEIGSGYRIGNIGFLQDRPSDNLSFDGLDFPWGVYAYVEHDISDDVSIEARYDHDLILRNNLYGIISYRGNFFSMGIGPYFGLFNSSQLIKPGISSRINLEYPGVAFISFRGDNTFGRSLASSDSGQYVQERNLIRAGFYVPNARVFFQYDDKVYSERSSGGEILDSFTQYSLHTDIFKKNTPYRIELIFGYRNVSRIFDTDISQSKHSLGTLVVGTNLDIAFNEAVDFLLHLDSGLFTFGLEDLSGNITNSPGPGGYMFEATTGLSVNLDT